MYTFQLMLNSIFDVYCLFRTSWIHHQEDFTRTFCMVFFSCIYVSIILSQSTVRKTWNTKNSIYRNWVGPSGQGIGPLLGFHLFGTTLKYDYIHAPNRIRTHYPCYPCLQMIADSRGIRRCSRSDLQFEDANFK